jgi:hypothetical protein
MISIPASNNVIIEQWADDAARKLHESEINLGIKHRRTKDPKPLKYRFRKSEGEIRAISFALTKGLIMTHKGRGKFQERGNRKEKPFFNPVIEEEVAKLADDIAANTGDVICGNLLIK